MRAAESDPGSPRSPCHCELWPLTAQSSSCSQVNHGLQQGQNSLLTRWGPTWPPSPGGWIQGLGNEQAEKLTGLSERLLPTPARPLPRLFSLRLKEKRETSGKQLRLDDRGKE